MNNFWKQPAKGFDENSRGRKEDEISERESQIGFKLPQLYKDLMRLQNGGYMRKKGYKSDINDFTGGLLMNGSNIAPINGESHYYDRFDSVLLEYLSQDEIKKWANSEYCYPERLIIISAMDGHSNLCLDYGWKSKFPLLEPEVCAFNLETGDGFPKEILREKTFADFINNLVYSGYECESFYYSIHYNQTIDELSKYISKNWNIELKEYNDDGYGWYNFDKYFFGLMTDANNIKYRFWLTPNKHIAGTFLFQELSDNLFILKIEEFDMNEKPIFYTKNIRDLILKLNSNDVKMSEILIPEY